MYLYTNTDLVKMYSMYGTKQVNGLHAITLDLVKNYTVNQGNLGPREKKNKSCTSH